MNDFKAEPAELREEMLSAAQCVLKSGWYVLGKEVVDFEKKWAQICGVDYAVGVGNGMDALEISMRALDIGPGDEVITTPMTAFATVLAIMRAGAIPVLADIDADSALLDPESVKRCISPKTKAVILVHLYGQIRDMDAWVQLCDSCNVHLIEDCAQSHLATWEGQTAGSFGKAGAYSFYPTKNLGAVGDGGMLVTNDVALSDRASSLRNYGQSVRYYHPDIGMNSRLDEIQAAILQVRLNWLPEFTRRRQYIAKKYLQNLRNKLIHNLAKPQEIAAHSYHLYVIKCEKRNALQKHLESFGVQTHCHYPVPIHLQESCKNIRRDPLSLASSELHANTCLSLPCHPQMSEEDIDIVINAVNQFQG